VLDQVGNLGGIFGKKEVHPLADAQELKRIIAALPKDNAFRAVDEIAGWLESAQAADQLPIDRLYEATRQFDEAIQPHLRRLCREYLHTPRMSRTEEKRLWSISHGFWLLLADTYERCLNATAGGGRPAEQLKTALPLICVRLIAALAAALKWEQFHYGPSANAIWARLGSALLRAEAAGVGTRPVQFGGSISSPVQEYQKVMVFQAASTDSLLPLEIELAERLIEHFLGGFIFTAQAEHDCVYWVDLQLAQPPLRLALMPAAAVPSQRFFKPGPAHAAICDLLKSLERGDEIPADLKLGAQYYPRTLIPVLRHLAAYLAPIPPQRRHDRHRVKHRMSVLNGLVNAFVAFSGEFGGKPAGLQMESWVVDNVSRGGFGAQVNDIPADWLRVGSLVAMQPEGGENWLLGIVRRYYRATESDARVGIETMARHACSVELRVRAASSYAAIAGTPALLLENRGEPGEVRVVLPPASFDLQESMEFSIDGRRCLLAPTALLEQTADYEVARYQLTRLA